MRAENTSAILRRSGMSVIGLAISEAIAAQQRNDYQSAIDKWRTVALVSSEIEPVQAARAWFSVGFLFEIQVHDNEADRANLNEAIEAYSSSIRLDGDYADAYFNRGNLRYRLRQYDAAIIDYASSSRLSPKPSVFYNRGNAYFDTIDSTRQYRTMIGRFPCCMNILMFPWAAFSTIRRMRY